ncbi:MAG: hypothetical protein DCE90_01985 [Pseudanabaena sp.]|nr:MAG: hypothetical protein DCE90_01985 [Pseudanabaena sp.]
MATNLSAGDVAFLSIIGDNPDTFSFVLLKDIDAGTIINVTDNGWLASGGFRTGEGVLQYVSPSAQTVGTVINFVAGAANTGWTVSSGSLALSTDGDSLTAFQGDLTSPILLAAVTNRRDAFDADATNSNTTALPTGLTVGTNAIAVGLAAAEFDNSRYTGATTFASIAEARTALNTASNWTGSNTDVTNFSGTFSIGGGAAPTITGIDLSKYIRTGLFNLPVALTGSNQLAREVSAVTYNKDTDTLFMVGDGGTAIVQVSKTGELINSMTLSAGLFADPEGLAYIGNNQFVIADERVRTASLFTYAANTTLAAASVQTVDLGTNIGNVGIEGITFDPQTNGFIAVKEATPAGVFQTTIDFAGGTASNGSASTVNSTNLFDPALAGLGDFADVFALSNLSVLNGKPEFGNLLLISQESGKIVNIDRNGTISSSLTIIPELNNPLSVADQQFEGIAVDNDGTLYVTSENGDTPQLSVYKLSTVPNQAPTAVVFGNPVTAISELDSTVAATRVANISITDDQLGVNTLSLTGADAAAFEIVGNSLFLKANTVLDFETKPSFSVNVNADDSTVGSTPDATATFTLNVTNIVDETPLPTSSSTIFVTEVAPWSSGNSLVAADWFELTNTGSSAVNISGWKFDDSSNSFASSVLLSGIATINAGESVIFIEGATPNPAFLGNWFGATPPANLKIGNYSGGGVGLSTAGDAVNIFNAAGVLQASVTFGTSPAASPFTTFDNAALLQNATIATQSAVGVNGAFSVVNSQSVTEIGSPGAIASIKISQIQGASQVSPLVGQVVSNVAGIVTAVDSNGFYFQDPNPDNDIATSEGIFVFTSSRPTVAVGDSIAVTGTVSEFTPGGASTGNLSTTQIGGTPRITILSSGNSLPAATIIGAGGRVPPSQNIDNDGLTSFDAVNDGIDFFESLEGMRVTAKNLQAVSATNSFGEIYAVVDNGASATGLSTRGTINISPTDFNPERIQIDIDNGVFDFPLPNVNVGAKIGDVTGVVGYNFGNFEIIPTEAFGSNIVASTLQPEVTTLAKSGDTLKVATYNVLNLDPQLETGVAANNIDDDIANGRFAAIAQQIVNNLGTPDIIGLQEVQDNSGAQNDGVTSASLTLQTLINAIAAAGGPTYKFIDNTFIGNNTSGGQPGANIRTAFLYNESRVGLVEGSVKTVPASDFSAFAGSRLPIIADFTFNGETVTVVNNHFSSKGGSRPLFGTTQPSVGDEANGNGQENVAVNGSLDERRAQAQAVNNFVDSILASKLNANVVVVGDFNEFEFISPLSIVAGGANPVLTNLTNSIPENERYTFNFDGNSQSLDHILVSNNLSSSAQVDIVNINTEFVDNAQRASDHDPIVATIKFASTAPTLTTGGTTGDDVLIATPNQAFDGRKDILFTGAGNDEVELVTVATFSDAGDNRIDLGSGNDIIFVNKNDRLFGGSGKDIFEATESLGGNRMSGGAGDDDFFLGTGDRALGGDGVDRFFVGEGGGNLLSGGAGADQFWIFNGDIAQSANIIVDFQIGTDVIGFQGASFGFADLVRTGNNIAVGNSVIATFTGVNTASLTASSFVFL